VFQIFYYGKVVEKARAMSNWTDFFFAFVKGPGWFPGTERLGDITFVPEVESFRMLSIISFFPEPGV
jgi:hypothetical protein